MPDYSPEIRSRVMRTIRSDGGRAEVQLRRAVWRAGLRFRVHDSRLPGHPDLVFSGAKLAVFVDSRFWHGRIDEAALARMKPYWRQKLTRNRERDLAVNRALAQIEWTVLRLNEEDVLRDTQGMAARVIEEVRASIQRAKEPVRPQS